MYNWRKLTEEQRVEVLKNRKLLKRPWHSLPHHNEETGCAGCFHLIAACYEHRDIIGASSERMAHFMDTVFSCCKENDAEVRVWVFLPNHYHLLVKTVDVQALRRAMGKLRGKTSYQWNAEEFARGRKVWCDIMDKRIKNVRHYYATMNYIHHNPVKHGYVKNWGDWIFSSASEYLEELGRDKMAAMWQDFDCSKMGEAWD